MLHVWGACDLLESAARAMPRTFMLGAAAVSRAADGTIALSHALFMHVKLLPCITCERCHRRAVPPLPQRRGRPCTCSDSDVGCRAAGATSAMRSILIFAWCCVLRELPVLRVVGASSSPLWTCSRCGWRVCDPGGGRPPRHADRATPSIAQTPDFRALRRRRVCAGVRHRFLTPGRTFTVKGFAR